MSDAPAGPGWWLAVNGRWYPPELHPDVRAVSTASQTSSAPAWGPQHGAAGGWADTAAPRQTRPAAHVEGAGAIFAGSVFVLLGAAISMGTYYLAVTGRIGGYYFVTWGFVVAGYISILKGFGRARAGWQAFAVVVIVMGVLMFTLTVTGTIARAIQGLATPPVPELDELSEVDAQLVTDVSAMATVMPEGACAYLTSDAGVDALLDVIVDRPDGSPQEIEDRADRIYLYLLDAHDC